MAYLLPHLHSGWEVDQTIVNENERVVLIRFGKDHNSQCMLMDETLMGVADYVKNFCAVHLVDIDQVPDFNQMYELASADAAASPLAVMFFYRNKHIQVDLGTGNNNKITFPITNKQELVDIIETVYRGASKGRGLVVSPKNYSTKNRY